MSEEGPMVSIKNRTFDALPDTVDFRDTLFVPTLINVPRTSNLAKFKRHKLPILNQGREGACTGFALATVANYLLRVRGQAANADEVSAWMLYEMAKRYDEWPGEDYDGSSARGAMKGWFKHGLCALTLWEDKNPDPGRAAERAADALSRPLGAYFRVNHKDLVAMHAAINETGVLFATASVHPGWQVPSGEEDIRYEQETIGGHAFAIVGYDSKGFWIQNSWGTGWGSNGLARLSYADWLINGKDIWVAALGAPVDLGPPIATATMRSGAPHSYQSQVYADLRPHIITSKNDGRLDDKGTYGLTEIGLSSLITEQMPRRMADWPKKRMLLYAHGGLVSQDSAIQTVSANLDPLLKAQIYPLSFVWRSDVWNTIRNILQDAMNRRRDQALLDTSKDFLLDRVDDMLEVVARNLGGQALWNEMKENAQLATRQTKGAARLAADHLVPLIKSGAIDEIHLVGHSAGAIFLAPLAKYLAKSGVSIASLTLWAPACTITLFEETYLKLIKSKRIKQFNLFTLDDDTEQDDDCAEIYHKSLLYLVSHAFEERAHIPGLRAGEPLLGLKRDAEKIKEFWTAKTRQWHVAPGPTSGARHHGDFDNDSATLMATLNRISTSEIEAPLPTQTQTTSRDAQRSIRERLNRTAVLQT